MFSNIHLLSIIYLPLLIAVAASPTPNNEELVNFSLITNYTSNRSSTPAVARAMGTLVKDALVDPLGVVQSTQVFVLAYFGTNNDIQELVVDTGSAITTVGQKAPFSAEGISESGGPLKTIVYGSGQTFEGSAYQGNIDLRTAQSNAQVQVANQVFGVSNTFIDGAEYSGTLGLAPTALTEGKYVSGPPDATIPTVADNICETAGLPKQFALYLEPSSARGSTNGRLTFCSYDSASFIPPLRFGAVYPITRRVQGGPATPGNYFWALNLEVGYGDTETPFAAFPDSSNSIGILDSGANLIAMKTSAFTYYRNRVGGTVHSSGYLEIPSSKYISIPYLRFLPKTSKSTAYDLSPDAQVLPPARAASVEGARPGYYYLRVSELTNTGSYSYDFILGLPFLERYYSVYDAQNNRIGLAQTVHTDDVITPVPEGEVPPSKPGCFGSGCVIS